MKVLISGNTYAGSIIARYLSENQFQVVVQDDRQKVETLELEGIEVVSAPCYHRERTRSVFEHFSFGAVLFSVEPRVCPRPAVTPPEVFLPQYLGAVAVFSELCARFGVDHLIVLSDAAIYGNTSPEGATETVEPRKGILRGEAAAIGESIFRSYAERGAYKLTVLRVFNVAGAWAEKNLGERHVPERHLIPSCLTALNEESRFTLWGTKYPTPDGTAVRDFVHVLDLAEAVRVCLEKPPSKGARTYNVASGNPTSVREVLREAEKVTGTKLHLVEGPACKESFACRVGSPEKIKKELGWEPERVSLSEIIKSPWEFMRSKKDRCRGSIPELFGEVAVKIGFVSEEDVQRALEIQRRDIKAGRPRRLLGLILLEEGLIDNFQLIEILKYYDRKALKEPEPESEQPEDEHDALEKTQ